MNESLQQLVEDCARAAHDGTRAFPAIVATLAEAGVESYQADYRRAFTTYYLPSGDNHSVALHVPRLELPTPLNVAALQEAIKSSQRGELRYVDFLARSVQAGCVGYIVWIAGRQVTYFGRLGEVHVEKFPGAKV